MQIRIAFWGIKITYKELQIRVSGVYNQLVLQNQMGIEEKMITFTSLMNTAEKTTAVPAGALLGVAASLALVGAPPDKVELALKIAGLLIVKDALEATSAHSRNRE